MSQIRCVGAYMDNVMVPDHGPEIQALDMDEWRRVAKLPRGHSDLQNPVVYHTYKKRDGEYIHASDCCPTIDYRMKK